MGGGALWWQPCQESLSQSTNCSITQPVGWVWGGRGHPAMSSSRVLPEVQRASAQPPQGGELPPTSGQPWAPKPCPMTKASLLCTPVLTPLCAKVPSAKMKISSWPHFCGDSGNVHDVALPTPLTL